VSGFPGPFCQLSRSTHIYGVAKRHTSLYPGTASDEFWVSPMVLPDCVVLEKGNPTYVAKSGLIGRTKKEDKDHTLDYMFVA
jgi:hypothetical protein